MDWKNKVVLLTGASSGIGEALAIEMSRKGAIVGLIARRGEMLVEVGEKCTAVGGSPREFACDVTDHEMVKAAADSLRSEFGKIDMLIANAGIGGNNAETRAIQPDAFRKVIEVNLMGAVNAVHAVLPDMLKQGSGHLVAISSLAGFRGLPKSAAYCASKAGMTAMFESIRLDVKDKGLDVTVIQPGFIKTPLTSGREAKMPYLMELEDSIPHFIKAIEKKKRFAAFPWQLATLVRAGLVFPGWLYDKIAGGRKLRE